jgi:hypothetical protein
MAPEEYSRSSIYSLATGQGSGASVDTPPIPRAEFHASVVSRESSITRQFAPA